MAGDRHQLPPTTFFATAIEGEDDEEDNEDKIAALEAVSGFESLLDTLSPFLPNWMLEWHYRSRDERLIAFSNHHIYDSRLITFPGTNGEDIIRHVLVPHDPGLSGQEESASREVEEVIRLVFEHAETRPDETLGVITMGIKHANRIQAVLDRELGNHPELAEFFSLDRKELFFIKNLETVQGDEQQLMSLGWRFHRIWSTDWFTNREEEIERVISSYKDAVRFADIKQDELKVIPAEPKKMPQRNTPPAFERKDDITAYTRFELRTLAEWAMSDRLLRTDEELMHDMRLELGFQKLGARMRRIFEQALKDARSWQKHSLRKRV